MEYDGDPLVDFALMPFLDKMAYKQSKAAPRRAGAARMGPSGKPVNPDEVGEEPVNTAGFLEQEADTIPPDQVRG